jgi:predicted Rossmann fold flavoprotein
MQKYDVIIIGAGAAGLMCAAQAAKRGRKVLVIEHTAKIAEKIRISGGGRCNFTNLEILPHKYLSQNPHFCVSALKRYTQFDFIELVKSYKIAYHEKTLGQLFCDESATQIIEMLLSECEKYGAEIITSTKVLSVEAGYNLRTTNGDFSCESLVIACGGLSIPPIGASSFGYDIAKQFGLNIVPTQAALVPLTLGGVAEMAGVSVFAAAKIGKTSFEEGLLFTHKGLSGPAILQISSYWKLGNEVTINFAPNINVFEKLKELKTQNPKQELKTVIATFLPKKLAYYLCNESSEKIADLSNKRLQEIADNITALRVKPTGTEGYRVAEVTLGGVDTKEISSKTFEAQKAKGLFFIGEVLDVTGWLGGYNFQWAWSSGYCAGQFA